MSIPAATAKYEWILAIVTIAFVFSAFGNGANDVANSYATSVAAQTLTMPQVGFLSICTEFIGAVGLGARVTSTIKNGIISIDRFREASDPGTLMLAMGCAEVGSATWLMLATHLGMPVSTTQTVVGALIGVGFATGSPIKWAWASGSVSQVAASWGIAPLISAAFSALIFGTVKWGVLERADSFKWAMRLIPMYIATTCAILALFIVVETPTAPSLEEFGAGKAAGIILGVWAGCLLIAYVFFIPFFERKLIKKDPRVRFHHVILGPILRKDNPPLFWPGKGDEYVKNYYADAYGEVRAGANEERNFAGTSNEAANAGPDDITKHKTSNDPKQEGALPTDPEKSPVLEESGKDDAPAVAPLKRQRKSEPYERFIGPVQGLSWLSPQKWYGYLKFVMLQGVTRDVITHDSDHLRAIHARANRYDVRVEHLWTYCQVLSAMMMSIAHGANDVANAVGPWAAVYETYKAGEVSTTSPTPVWFLVVAGLLLGLGFWFYGYKIMRAMGNKITQMSPTRGFAVELGAAITVLLASRLALPVSTTQCLTGSVMGVALMNMDLGAVNWKQLAFIFMGWVATLPSAGLIAGLLCAMALNTPHF
ncbi:putative phosphate-repressible phosphate permease [Aaosphaeria arxii CBS 175.79]|uniref:Phosphate transporter n=1 Tax=Aaosphaeria arxii CBS 175.79 TaxID=1450172 RepID=A0A6A5Y8P8_9PLEO|nr:putative phosphate-repressible phosphate permease [Aaosphaeria arxii CBS 175.79]KAF2021377.1 putative phosphate-repressible phosphate permease [Aaosphaeria arxii CBS 175.79]